MGFLNTITKELFSVTSTSKVDSDTVIDIFDKFSNYISKVTVVVLDNASIHTSKKFKSKITEWEEKGLHLLYLPPYSPELNPIEMLWREMKYNWVNLNALDSFESYEKHIKELLLGFGTKYDINFV